MAVLMTTIVATIVAMMTTAITAAVTTMTTIDQQVTFLYTADLAQTARFYEEIIGLSLVLDQGVCKIYRVAGDAFLGFCERAGINRNHPDVILTLVSADIDGWHAHLLAHGVSIEQAPSYNATYNITHLFARDPNGYTIEIQTFHDPAWPTKPPAPN